MRRFSLHSLTTHVCDVFVQIIASIVDDEDGQGINAALHAL
jgi:hypothetical protein